MASLVEDKSGNFLVDFRYGGRHFRRSLDTRDREVAEAGVAKVDETLMRLKRGWLALPEGAEPGLFIATGGALEARPVLARGAEGDAGITLGALLARYAADLPDGAKQASTRLTERIHRKHLERLIGADAGVGSLTLAAVQRYAALRSAEKWRDEPIQGGTVLKELKTLRYVWSWGFRLGLVASDCPWQLRDLQLGRRHGREPFRTMEEIRRRIARGGLSEPEQARLWESLYLTGGEVEALLGHVREHATAGFVYPMVAFAALTGARRSELCRSRIDDFDFPNRVVHIRERKRDQSRAETQRKVDLHGTLAGAMEAWFAAHPGGQHTLAQDDGGRVSVDLASAHLNRTLAGHELWKVVPGFHALRHSFASILASKGVDQRIIDAFMGHQTEEMRARYQHLFPAARQRAIDAILG